MLNFFLKLLAVRDLISAGEQIAKPETWANRASATGFLSIAIVALLKFVPNGETIDQTTIDAIAEGVFAGWIVISSILHVRTVKDAGVPPKRRTK